MKKQLLSILALILCFCTVFVFASCGKKNDDDASSDSLGESNNESFDVEEGLEDVDADTAETIFAQMKADYNATIGYKDAYSLTIDWVEDQTDTESGDDSSNETTKNKTVDKQTVTADPASGKAAAVLNEDRYENDKKISTSVMESKYFNQNSKNYVYYSSKTDDIVEYEDYNSLTDYGFANAKKDIILSESFNVHFAESFGNPFAASSASDLKSIYTSVLNELKAADKARYEAEGYTVKSLTAKADVIFNKDGSTNIFKRTITISSNLQDNGGTYQNNLTVESLLKTKDGKILSFVSTTTQTSTEKVGDTYNHQADLSSSLAYTFDYKMSDSIYNSVKTELPAVGVVDAPDSYEAALTLVVNGNEIPMTIMGDVSAESPVSDTLNSVINEVFADANIDFDGKWYTDSACTKELDVSSITTVEKLQSIKKLYTNSLKVSNTHALFIDSGKMTVNLPKNYTVVFGELYEDTTLGTDILVREYDAENNLYRISYAANDPTSVTIKINGTAIKYDTDPDKSQIQEESAGEFFHEFAFEGGKIYFISRAETVDKTNFSLDTFFVYF